MKPPVPGVATALALTPSGGAAVPVECMLLSGRGRLILTGNLIRGARDSGQVALSLARSRSRRLGIDPADFLRTDVHFNVPGEASAKDGSSAGLAMLMALISAMIRKPLDPRSAYVGEISLSGTLHAVGGVEEKVPAAAKAGMRKIFIPEANAPDAKSRPKSLEIIPVGHVDAALVLVFPKAAKKN